MPFCPQCGHQLEAGAGFCGECGSPVAPPPASSPAVNIPPSRPTRPAFGGANSFGGVGSGASNNFSGGSSPSSFGGSSSPPASSSPSPKPVSGLRSWAQKRDSDPTARIQKSYKDLVEEKRRASEGTDPGGPVEISSKAAKSPKTLWSAGGGSSNNSSKSSSPAAPRPVAKKTLWSSNKNKGGASSPSSAGSGPLVGEKKTLWSAGGKGLKAPKLVNKASQPAPAKPPKSPKPVKAPKPAKESKPGWATGGGGSSGSSNVKTFSFGGNKSPKPEKKESKPSWATRGASAAKPAFGGNQSGGGASGGGTRLCAKCGDVVDKAFCGSCGAVAPAPAPATASSGSAVASSGSAVASRPSPGLGARAPAKPEPKPKAARGRRTAADEQKYIDSGKGQAQMEDFRKRRAQQSFLAKTVDPATCFCSIRCKSFTVHAKSNGKPDFATYQLDVEFDETLWSVSRRWRQFEDLDRTFKNRLKAYNGDGLPKEAKKNRASKFDSVFLNERVAGLDAYLSMVTQMRPAIFQDTAAGQVFFRFISPSQMGDEKPAGFIMPFKIMM